MLKAERLELEVSEGLLLGLGLVVVVAFSLMGESGGLEVVAEPPLGVVWRGMLDLVLDIFRGVLGGISGEEAILLMALVGEQEHMKWLVTLEESAVVSLPMFAGIHLHLQRHCGESPW